MYTLYSYTPATDTETSTPYDTLATAMEAFKALAFRLGKTGTDTDLILYHGDRCNALVF